MSAGAQEVRREIVHELSQLTGIEAESFTPDATLQELDVDSLDLVELRQIVEERYDVQLQREDFTDVVTVGHALDAIVPRLSRPLSRGPAAGGPASGPGE